MPKNSDFPEVIAYIGEVIVGLPEKEELTFFKEIVTHQPDILFKTNKNKESLAVIAVKNGHSNILKFIVEKAPTSLEIKDSQGDFPLLIAAKEESYSTFIKLFDATSKTMRLEKNKNGDTIAHYAAESLYPEKRLVYILEHASELASATNKRKQVPAHIAARNSNGLNAIKNT